MNSCVIKIILLLLISNSFLIISNKYKTTYMYHSHIISWKQYFLFLFEYNIFNLWIFKLQCYEKLRYPPKTLAAESSVKNRYTLDSLYRVRKCSGGTNWKRNDFWMAINVHDVQRMSNIIVVWTMQRYSLWLIR